MLNRRSFVLGVASTLATPSVLLARSQPTIFVNMQTGMLRFGDLDTPVVLPGPAAFAAMQRTSGGVAYGVVSEVNKHPTWVPTPNTRKRKPHLPAAIRYGEPGHPLGVYRLRVRWDAPLTTRTPWPFCYLHGGAKTADLHQRLSLGCVRIPDPMVTAIAEQITGTLPRVQYTW